jgi:hypothetical protein
MAWSVLDLSIITDELIGLLNVVVDPGSTVWTKHGGSIDFFPVTVSGAMPEADRDGAAGCLLSLYLLHVSQDPHFRNTPVSGPLAQVNAKHPLSLNLYYLLTSFANKNYNQEQQAMSIAMRCFHEQAIMKVATPHAKEYSITMEVETADEMSRLWQALSAPYRLSVVYKVSIVFVSPSKAAVPAAMAPTSVGLVVSPQDSASGAPARIFGAAVRESLAAPEGASAGDADSVVTSIVPGLVRPGDDLIVTGDGFDLPAYAKVYLIGPGAVETDITGWRQDSAASTLRVHFPRNPAAVPPSPPPGNYLLALGSDGPKIRTNAAAVAIAARVDPVKTPPGLEGDTGTGVYTVQGAGFTAAVTEVRLGDVALVPVAAAPSAGEFQVAPDGTSFAFKAPAGLAAGHYYLDIKVNQIRSPPPSWYVVVK